MINVGFSRLKAESKTRTSVDTLLYATTHPASQFIFMVGFLVLALYFRFVLPRYDYWDVVYESTFIVEGGFLEIDALFSFLLKPFVDQFMTLTKLTVLLTNYLAKQHVIIFEIILAWILLIIGYLLLLSVLQLPFSRKQSINTQEGAKMLIVFLLYWWPATLPSLTNNWFAVQYGLVLTSGLGSIYCFTGQDDSRPRQLFGCVLFLLCAASHGTGLLLGPVLSIWLYIKRRAPLRVIFFLALTSLALLALIWMQHQTIGWQGDDIDFSLASVKFFMRIITPPFWEQAVFILVIAPMLILAFSQLYVKRARSSREGATVILFWGVLVWIVTFVARYEFQDHANPHYLRFYVLLYITLFVTIIDKNNWINKKGIAAVVSVIFMVLWVKGSERGVSMAEAYRMRNLQGYASLVEDITIENSKTDYLYPIRNHRLTNVLIPRLIHYEPYGYRAMLVIR
jgi:hypothetical protein